MDEDLRSRYRRDYSRKPIRPVPPRPPQPTPTPTVLAVPPAPPSSIPAAPLTEISAEPTRRPKSRRRLRLKRLQLLTIIVFLIAAGGSLAYLKSIKNTGSAKHYFPAYITKDQINIPVYYPVNLPPDYAVDNDFKIIQQNVLYYSVSTKAGDKFYITIQKLPTNFDFVGFKKKFVKPDEYNTSIGSNLVGPAGSSLIGSIQTNQNVWILLNSSALGSVNAMETITRALQQVSL